MTYLRALEMAVGFVGAPNTQSELALAVRLGRLARAGNQRWPASLLRRLRAEHEQLEDDVGRAIDMHLDEQRRLRAYAEWGLAQLDRDPYDSD